ncbi:transposase [Nocardia takedensis]
MIRRLATRLLTLRDEIAACTTRAEASFATHPWWPILTSVPGIGVLLAARFLVETGGDLEARFGTENRLASYAGLSPVRRSSGTTLAKLHRPVRYNRALRRVFYLASTAAAFIGSGSETKCCRSGRVRATWTGPTTARTVSHIPPMSGASVL